MATYIDPFTDTSGTNLQSRASAPYGDWVKHPASGTPNLQISSANRARQENSAGTSLYYWNVDPADADYSFSAVLTRISADSATLGVCARLDETAQTFYHARVNTGTQVVQIYKFVAGSPAQLGSSVFVSGMFPSNGSTRKLTIDVSGTTIRALLDDVEKISVTDSSITAAGHPGLRSNTASSDSLTIHYDDATLTDSAATVVTATIGQAVETSSAGAMTPKPWLFVAASTDSRTSAGALDPGMPTGWLPGDWLIGIASYRSAGASADNLTEPDGWALRDSRLRGTAGRVWLFTRKAGTTNDTSFTMTGSPNPFSLAIIAIRHRGQVSFDTYAAGSGTASAQTAPVVTPAGVDEYLLRAAISAVAGTSGGYTWEAGATEVLDFSAEDGTSAAIVTIGAAVEDAPSSGAADQRTVTYSSSSSYVTYTVALSPLLEALGQAIETSSAGTMVRQIIGQAREQFIASPVSAILTMPVGATAVPIGQSLETSVARGLVVRRVIGQALEADDASRMRVPGGRASGSRGMLMGVGG